MLLAVEDAEFTPSPADPGPAGELGYAFAVSQEPQELGKEQREARGIWVIVRWVEDWNTR